MAKTQEVTPYYIRTREGECFYVDTLAEALKELTSENGYRLTLRAGGKEVVIRRSSEWSSGILEDEVIGTASLTIREV